MKQGDDFSRRINDSVRRHDDLPRRNNIPRRRTDLPRYHDGLTKRHDDISNVKTEKKPAQAVKKIKEVGSSRGIETMFRSSFRTQMDMLALATTKANIMISINGLIASALIVSGSMIYASKPLFLPPLSVFMLTSAISIYFAILAASPVKRHSMMNFNKKPTLRDFKKGKANALIFEDYANLSIKDYKKCMHDLLHNNQLTYTKMIEHLYWLGITADRKFKMLRYSYGVFRAGIALSILMLLGIQLFVYVSKPAETFENNVNFNNTTISKFQSIYEPSGIQQLSDGRFIIVEDEGSMKIISFQANQQIIEKNIDDSLLKLVVANIDDLEGVTVDDQGYIYVITSHSRTKKKGIRKVAREQLVRFRIEGEKIVDAAAFSGLRDYFEQSGIFTELGRKKPNDLNIEAISFDSEKKRLLIGFRFPRIDDRAVIAILENPQGIFERNEKLQFSDQVIYLDLYGKGIRSLTYDTHLKGYLITNEARGKKTNEKHSRLWFWSGNPNDNPRTITIPGLKNIDNAEGLTTAMIGDKAGILIVGDNGNAKKRKPASYLLQSYSQLSVN